MVPLFGYVPNIQEIAIAGRGNPPSRIPGCAIQCGTNFFV